MWMISELEFTLSIFVNCEVKNVNRRAMQMSNMNQLPGNNESSIWCLDYALISVRST